LKDDQDRRRARRLTVNLKAERLSCTNNCSVFIENLSEKGIHMITAPSKNAKLFVPGSEVELKLKIATGSTIKLQCNVKWSYDNTPEDLTNSVGLEIIDPPDAYLEFVKTFN
jgi:hypothetical protein